MPRSGGVNPDWVGMARRAVRFAEASGRAAHPGGRALPRQRVLACERRCVTLDEDSSVPTKPHISLIEPGDSEDSAPQILERLVHQAEHANASDIHLHIHEGAASVAFRLDGVMTP